MSSGGARYARGNKAWGICERCSEKRLLKTLVYDGQFPDLKVCPDCWDPKHPQEYLPSVTDPTTLYDPTGDPDKGSASTEADSFILLEDGSGFLLLEDGTGSILLEASGALPVDIFNPDLFGG